MTVRQGGTYEVDPGTGEERRISGTEQPDQASDAVEPEASPEQQRPSRAARSRADAAPGAPTASQE